MDLVKWMLTTHRDQIIANSIYVYHLLHACWHGYREIAELLINDVLLGDLSPIDVCSYLIEGACSGGHMELVLFLIGLGATNLERGFVKSVTHKKFAITRLLSVKNLNLRLVDLNYILEIAIEAGEAWLVNFCIERGGNVR